MKKISLCLTNYNRVGMLVDSFSKVKDDDRIDDIVISDDCSSPDVYMSLLGIFGGEPKVRISRNSVNKDCYHNKRIAVGLAKNDYVIILDSDNQIDTDYIDAIYNQEWAPDLVLAPEFARPMFDYRAFSGMDIYSGNVASMLDKPMFTTMLNTMNYFLHKNLYTWAWDDSVDPVTADSIYQNYNILRLGGTIRVVEGMQYDHKVHDGSHYKQNNHRTGNFYDTVLQKLKMLK